MGLVGGRNFKVVSVAICTWIRAKLLDQTLHSFHRVRVPSELELEILVVNDNRSYATDETIARHS
jgi:glycosyltransferase involved in cell wall biosynthesis